MLIRRAKERRKRAAVVRKRRATYIMQWRLHRQLSREELAAKSGVRLDAIAAIEGGRVGFTVETLDKLAAGLDCKPSDLLSPTGFAPHLTKAQRDMLG